VKEEGTGIKGHLHAHEKEGTEREGERKGRERGET
jgi:hypothetical protein